MDCSLDGLLNMLKRFTPILSLVALCWLVFLVNQSLWKEQSERDALNRSRGSFRLE
jgi:hypothetical protein